MERPSTSFFDDPSIENRQGFWIQSLPPKHRLSNALLEEGELLMKETPDAPLTPFYFQMFQDRLVYMNVSIDFPPASPSD